MGPNTQLIIEEAKKRNMRVQVLAENHSIIELEHEGKTAIFRGSLTEKTAGTFVLIANHKNASYKVLAHRGFQTPQTVIASSEDDACRKAEQIGYPLVVKPSVGHQGIGVTAHIESEEELRNAYRFARQSSDRSNSIIVQQHVSGRDYRVLVIGYKVFAVAERVPAHVTGNGTSTIQELIDQKNQERKDLKEITLDDAAIQYLRKQGYTPASVLPQSTDTPIRSIANIATGGEVIECTDALPPKNRTFFQKIAEAVRGDVVGIDVICDDITQPLTDNYTIIELNQNPDFYPFLSPTKGKPRNAAPEILRLVFSNI